MQRLSANGPSGDEAKSHQCGPFPPFPELLKFGTSAFPKRSGPKDACALAQRPRCWHECLPPLASGVGESLTPPLRENLSRARLLHRYATQIELKMRMMGRKQETTTRNTVTSHAERTGIVYVPWRTELHQSQKPVTFSTNEGTKECIDTIKGSPLCLLTDAMQKRGA